MGATRFCEIASWQWPPGARHQRQGVPDVLDIGFTWLAGSAQRTSVNTEAKLLMMTHAFEVWEVHRVALQTDVRNKRSWAAIERIGGQLDGIMRADRPGSDDTVRTSARFSIVAEEWPDVKARLAARLEARTGSRLSVAAPARHRGRPARGARAKRPGPGDGGRDLAQVQRVHGRLGLVLGPDGGHRLAGPVDLPGQLISPLDRVAEDLDEGLDHGLEGRDVIVPDDDSPQILEVEEGVNVLVDQDGELDDGAGFDCPRSWVSEVRTGRAEPDSGPCKCSPVDSLRS